jgi:hypothetical protein
VLANLSNTFIIASLLSLSETSKATVISATDTPGPKTLFVPLKLLIEPIESVKLLITRAARRKNPAKKKIPPKDGPVVTMTPGRE